MKASLDWLKKYVDIKLSNEQLAHKLIMAGIHVDSFEKIDHDVVFDFEITSNRSDCLSHIGIAREIAALTGQKLKTPEDLISFKDIKVKKELQLNILADDLCPKYTAAVVENVQIKPSPVWIKKKIEAIGARVVNNIVDITNYLLMETGQPMHAFDKDKIAGGIVVRKAVKGEKVVTIDKVERELNEGMLVIADEQKVIAIAGVMGALNTEVTEQTKNIVLESALFDPISVRRTARLLGLSTDASYRFERSPDPDMIERCANRCVNMFKEIANGSLTDLVSIGKAERQTFAIDFSPEKANQLLGLEIDVKQQKKILEALNFTVEEHQKNNYNWKIITPKTRKDLSQSVDIAEEIIRIYGYDKIPETIPHIIGNTIVQGKDFKIRKKIKNIMAMLSFNEIITYSLVSGKMQDVFVKEKDRVTTLVNALSQEHQTMTNTLMIGMLKSIGYNINRKNTDISFFEIGKQYKRKGKQDYKETYKLSIGLTGNICDGWRSKPRKSSIFDVKGVVLKLLQELKIKEVKIEKTHMQPFLDAEMRLLVKGKNIGYIGRLKPEILKMFTIKEEVFCAEIDVEKLIDLTSTDIKFTPLTVYPSVTRDISLIVDETVTSEKIKEVISRNASKLLQSTELVDLYKGKGIPKGKTNLVYRLEYRSEKNTLTDQEVDREHEKVRYALLKVHGVELK